MGEPPRKLKTDGADLEWNNEDSFDLDDMLHPAQAFSHPADVVNDPDLTLNEKRAILASWASMLAQLSLYRHCAALLMKGEGRSHSTMSWTHFAPWTPMRRRRAAVTAASCASAGFSAAALTRAAIANLSTRWRNDHVALSIHACGDDFILSVCGGSRDKRGGLRGDPVSAGASRLLRSCAKKCRPCLLGHTALW